MTPSLLHPNASITDLLEDETGNPLDAREVLQNSMTEVLRLKYRLQRALKTGQGRYLCELCGVAVYLVAMPDTASFVFRHLHEDGSCRHITKSKLTTAQINAYRYDGQRESVRHKRIKQLVDESIQCDPRFTRPVVEGTWKGREGERRRPDVRSRFCDALDIAFEVQLSTTFDSVMVDREEFYRKEGGLLLWVFGEFDPERARLMMKICFAVNNRTAYAVNEETLEASRQAGALMLLCHYDQPVLRNGKIEFEHCQKLVSFEQLTLDQAGQRAYLVDTDAIEANLKRQLQGPALSEQLEDFWLARVQYQGRAMPGTEAMDARWSVLQSAFQKKGSHLPGTWSYAQPGIVLSILYSAKHGAPVGWGYEKFWDVAHHVLTKYGQFGWVFYAALECYGRLADLEAQDKNGKWRKKVSDWRAHVPAENHEFDRLIMEAFPELGRHIQAQRGGVDEWEPLPF
jgi:hypothetical protein